MRPENIADIDAALTDAARNGIIFPKFTKDEFALPSLLPRLAEFSYELENSRGFLLLRGLPTDRHDVGTR